MPEERAEFVLSVLSACIFVLVLAVATIMLIRAYTRKQSTLKEKEQWKHDFERSLLHTRVQMEEQAFTYISQEIHDNIGQMLTLARLHLQTLGLPDDRIQPADTLLQRVISDLRHLSHQLNSDFIRERGLGEAILQLLDNIQRTGRFHTIVRGSASDIRMSEDRSLILFRIIQEVVNNIIRHSGADRIEVDIDAEPDGVIVTISDNGDGFQTAQVLRKGTGIGIQNMLQRSMLIDATIDIDSEPGQGTRVTIHANTLSTSV